MTPLAGDEPGGSSPGGGSKRKFWEGYGGKKSAFALAALGTVGVLLYKEVGEDPMVPFSDRLVHLLGIDEKEVRAMVDDTHLGRTCSSRFKRKRCSRDRKITSQQGGNYRSDRASL